MTETLTSEPITAWLLHDAQHQAGRAFNTFPPYACKLCDEPTEPTDWKRHLNGHRASLEAAAKRRQRERVRNLKNVTRLRREAASL